MNNMQYVVKDDTRYAMHVAVELCEQGDFDSVTDAFRWLMQERDDSERGSDKQVNEAIVKLRQTVRDAFSKTHISMLEEGNAIMRAIDAVETAELGSGTCENVWAEFGKFKCSECAMEVNAISTNTTTPRPIVFCPNCGRKAVER